MRTPARPTSVCMAFTETVKFWMEQLETEGCYVNFDEEAGTAEAVDSQTDTVVYRALQKGYNQPWIVGCYNSTNFTWEKPECP